MKYEQQILNAFKHLGFNPRGRQVEDIDKIMRAFLDDGFKTVVLSAPTGTGKSIIGAVVAEAIHTIRFPEIQAGASFLLTPTIALQEQYEKTFRSSDPRDLKFRLIKGAGNFECSALSTVEEPQTAESCALRLFQKEHMVTTIENNCDSCLFAFQRKTRDSVRHLICNYSYYFIDRMFTEVLAKRAVCVFDEAHLINDLFTEHNAIHFSDSRLKVMLKEINEQISVLDVSVYNNLLEVCTDLMQGKINSDNYMEYLEKLAEAYGEISDTAIRIADKSIHDQKRYLKLSKLSKKYNGLACKINDLFCYNYPHAFEFKQQDLKRGQNENEISIKCIFVGDMFNQLINADYNLLMSATFSEQFAKQTLTLENSIHIRLDPSFPPENKQVVFLKPQKLSFETMKDPKVIGELHKTCVEIVNRHAKLNERGIILAPSFIITEGITEALEKNKVPVKIFEHRRGDKLAESINRFTKYNSGPALLLTPSGFEGLDFAGDLSRYQIIVKCPFGSLGEARMKYILNKHPTVYNLLALMKIVQGAGRSVRGPNDWAVTYMLDSNAQRIWTSNLNEWSNEFSTRFISNLSVLDM
jgi:ATP-dependent DNA helicase DinG